MKEGEKRTLGLGPGLFTLPTVISTHLIAQPFRDFPAAQMLLMPCSGTGGCHYKFTRVVEVIHAHPCLLVMICNASYVPVEYPFFLKSTDSG